MRRFCLLALYAIVSGTVSGLTAQTVVPPIPPMRALYVEDQRDRGVLMSDSGEAIAPDATRRAPDFLDNDTMMRHDAERRTKVRTMLGQGLLVTAQDFHDASFIFQHGQSPDDYLFAHVLAIEAVSRGDTGSRWIAAATLDRYLQTIGQKQIFGTQYLDEKYAYYLQHRTDKDLVERLKAISPQQTQEPYNDKLVPAAIRQDFCVPSLESQQTYVRDAHAGGHLPIPRITGCQR